LTHIHLSKRIIDAKHIIVRGPASDHDLIILQLQFKQKRKGNLITKVAKIRVT
jgi:hypothetical protein